MDLKLDAEYWNKRYIDNSHRWDIGYPSPAITNYFDKIKNKSVKILIPGCGSAYEGEYLIKNGFTNVTLLDVSEEVKNRFLKRVPEFKNFLITDFFELETKFDYIIEQTFFCALNPKLRMNYVNKMNELIAEGGKLIGLMFHAELYSDHPPFGGFKEEYVKLFETKFKHIKMNKTTESIEERLGRELFIEISN
jgi:SAM-dependent methyltransferase